MSNLLFRKLRRKYQNEVVQPSGYANGGIIQYKEKDRRSQKIHEEYLENIQAHPRSYWTRETMLEAIGKLLEGYGHETSEAEEYFGELTDEELFSNFYAISDKHQPRGAYTSDDELLFSPEDRRIFGIMMEKQISKSRRRK